MIKLYIVTPCFNESAVIDETARRLKEKLDHLADKKIISTKSRILFIDDGSSDDTWNKIEVLHEKDSVFGGVKLSRNRGHQNALLAGLMAVKDDADVVISMDADLQDDIDAVDKMLKEYKNGSDIVYGVRSDRATDTMFKRNTALVFYKLMSKLGVDSVYNHADYRLMSARALHELSKFDEANLFLRGIIPLIGLKSSTVEYVRSERYAGETKYTLKKMINFAIDGVTSFSIKPLRLITAIGLITSALAIAVAIYAFTTKLLGLAVEGWAFMTISIWFIGGVQMFCIGIAGEYIGKIYNEVKARPRFIVEKQILHK